MKHLLAVVLQIWFFPTPIVYTLDIVPDRVWGLPAHDIIRLNPMSQFVGAMRDSVYLLEWPNAARLGGITLLGVGSFWIGWSVFCRLSEDISEEL